MEKAYSIRIESCYGKSRTWDSLKDYEEWKKRKTNMPKTMKFTYSEVEKKAEELANEGYNVRIYRGRTFVRELNNEMKYEVRVWYDGCLYFIDKAKSLEEAQAKADMYNDQEGYTAFYRKIK